MKHLLSIESLDVEDIHRILDAATAMKAQRAHLSEAPHDHTGSALANQCWGMIFSKSSTRTRISFEVGIRELGGSVLFLSANEIQLGRGEPIRDTARVMGRMLQGAVIRTFAQQDIVEFAEFSGIPTINALTDEEHPCQILSDLFTIVETHGALDRRPQLFLIRRELLTIQEEYGDFSGKTVCFVGDGACNVARSWIWAAAKLNFTLKIAAPAGYQPDHSLLAAANKKGNIFVTNDLRKAAEKADVLYTDVWVSMGKETETEQRIKQLNGYRIDAELTKLAPKAMVMHCLPAYRGMEISDETFELNAKTIFDQAENRLHAQKAILCLLSRE